MARLTRCLSRKWHAQSPVFIEVNGVDWITLKLMKADAGVGLLREIAEAPELIHAIESVNMSHGKNVEKALEKPTIRLGCVYRRLRSDDISERV